MNQEQINDLYTLFEIPNDKMPEYTTAENFAQRFKKCSVLKDVETSYNSTTIRK